MNLSGAGNTNFVGLLRPDRTRIADALGVTQKTISMDLKEVYTEGINPSRPKGGRPKKGAPARDKAREIVRPLVR